MACENCNTAPNYPIAYNHQDVKETDMKPSELLEFLAENFELDYNKTLHEAIEGLSQEDPMKVTSTYSEYKWKVELQGKESHLYLGTI